MTVQFADTIINECAEVNLSGLHLYAVLTGDIGNKENTASYSFLQKPNKENLMFFLPIGMGIPLNTTLLKIKNWF